MKDVTSAIINGEAVDAERAMIPIQDRGFRYGDGVFETIAVHNGVPYQFATHIDRLERGLEAIHIAFDTHPLQGFARQLLRMNQVTEGILRIQVTRGIGGMGYLPDPAHPKAAPCFTLETLPMPDIPAAPVALWQSSYAKPSPKALPVRFKLCQGLNSTLARMEASSHGCFDALLSNEQKHVCETSSANLFWVKDDVLYTPSLASGALEGAMRSAILRLSPWRIQETEATAGQLTRADAVLISNAIWKVLPVNTLRPQNIQWQSEALAQQLRTRVDEDIRQHCDQQRTQWV